jgi:hypothetical protein
MPPSGKPALASRSRSSELVGAWKGSELQARFYGTLWDTQSVGDVAQIHLRLVHHPEHVPLLFRERIHESPQQRLPLGLLESRIRTQRRRIDHPARDGTAALPIVLGGRDLERQLPAPAYGAQVVQSEVCGDAEEPCLEGASPLPRLSPAPNPQEDLLRQVAGRLLVADDTGEVAADLFPVAGEERLERLRVALSDPRHKLFIGWHH